MRNNTSIIRRTQKYFPSEIILFLAHLYLLLSRYSSLTSSLTLISILAISLKVDKARVYSPVVILSVLLYTLRALLQINNWVYFIIQVLLFVAGVALSLIIRVFEIPHRYGLYEQKYKDPSFTVGFLSKTIGDISVSIWYPAQEETNKFVPWMTSKDYRALYQIFYVDAAEKRRIPYWIFKFCTSYLETYKLEGHYGARIQYQEKYKIVLFSHGLGAHSRGYTCYTHWWAKQGYIVISLQHNYDVPCIDYRVEKEELGQQKWLYAKRNEQICHRKNEIVEVFKYLQKGVLDEVFGEKITIEEIMMAGHSFGGSSILEAGSQMHSMPLYDKVSRYLCLDPWVFPLSSSSYMNLQRPILFVNSQTFTKNNPCFYELHAKNQKLMDLNPGMSKILIRGLDHQHASDTLFTFGTIFVLTKTISNFRRRNLYVDVLVYVIRLFQDGRSGEEIVEMVEKEIKAKLPKEERYLKIDQRKLWQDQFE